jgi:ATP-dependent DNA helicase RecQ
MVLPKPTVVISPLLALLRDQHQKLIAHGVPCVRLDGTIRGKARREALERIALGGPLLVMTTPETLFSEALGDALLKSGISLAAVDEAHCISEWGHDFRPTYQRLGTRLRNLGRPPLLALTATATSRVRDAIVATLHMDDPTVVLDSPHRSNLSFEVIHCEGDMRLRALVRLVRRLRRPGIIYCSTRREVDETYLILRKLNIPCHRYHGAMPAAERDREQKKFMQRGRRTVMVATNAFGLGIDKHDIRYILHYQSPASLEQYVQEAGRGGRDGRKANCILLHDPADRHIHEALQARSRIRPDQLYRIGNALAAWDNEDKKPSLQALALSAELGPRVSGALIAKLEEAGLVECDKEGVRIIGERETLDADTYKLASQFDTLRIQDARRLDSLTGYANNVECRAVYLQEYFGEEPGEACGLCDVCEGRPERADGFFAPVKAPPKTVTKKKTKKASRSRRGGTSRRRRRGRGRRGRGRGSGSGDLAGPPA